MKKKIIVGNLEGEIEVTAHSGTVVATNPSLHDEYNKTVTVYTIKQMRLNRPISSKPNVIFNDLAKEVEIAEKELRRTLELAGNPKTEPHIEVLSKLGFE